MGGLLPVKLLTVFRSQLALEGAATPPGQEGPPLKMSKHLKILKITGLIQALTLNLSGDTLESVVTWSGVNHCINLCC